ncbi:MAG: monofunctional biosynthetic peptidoglycan transglycosylase [Pseudomonadota bacterium]
MKRLKRWLKAARKLGPYKLARRLLWFATKACLIFGLICGLWVSAYRFINPPITYLMVTEWWRLGELNREWLDLDEISPHLARSVLAAEDANFCDHWGFDFEEIQKALDETHRKRGASTITQQAAKNVFLWPDASWTRKGLEAGFAILITLFWPKDRTLEIYLNVAEFGPGVFGAEAGAARGFKNAAADLKLTQSARLAAVLPNPRERHPQRISANRAAHIADGAETLRADGRADCLGIE